MLLRLALILSLLSQTLLAGVGEQCVISACAPEFTSTSAPVCPPDCCPEDGEAAGCCCIESDDRPAPAHPTSIIIHLGERHPALAAARPIGPAWRADADRLTLLPQMLDQPGLALTPPQRLALLCVRTT